MLVSFVWKFTMASCQTRLYDKGLHSRWCSRHPGQLWSSEHALNGSWMLDCESLSGSLKPSRYLASLGTRFRSRSMFRLPVWESKSMVQIMGTNSMPFPLTPCTTMQHVLYCKRC